MNQLINQANTVFAALQSTSCRVLRGSIPILWFGDYESYSKSDLKVITVGLNPSDKEFVNNGVIDIHYRFPSYNNTVNSHIQALNQYFNHKNNPYKKWFAGFETILRAMGTSYYSGSPNRALHTDICCPFATRPTWSKLNKTECQQLVAQGFPLWQSLVAKLNPDIILFSVRQEYVALLGINQIVLHQFNDDKNGKPRKRPVVICSGRYGKATAIFGTTRNLPFGSLGNAQKGILGQIILSNHP